VGHRRAAGEEGPLEVHIQDLVPDLVGQPLQVGVRDEMGHAGVIDQHVESVEFLRRPFDHGADGGIVGDVGGVDQSLRAAAPDAVGGFLGLGLGFRVIHRDGESPLGEPPGHGPADSRGRPGHQCDTFLAHRFTL
jgi:hypothetical protein